MTNLKPKLLINYATYEAARHACLYFHYSKSVPCGKTVKFSVHENGRFIGCVIFGHGANNNSAKYFKLKQIEVCELVRVALSKHQTTVSRILSICIAMLKKDFKGVRLIFSYSDKTNQNHHGGIYQASNFIYLGERTTSSKGAYYFVNGKKMHGRSVRAKWGSDKNIPFRWSHAPSETKHLYVYPIDKSIIFQGKKYPKCAESKEIVASGFQSEEEGENPISALQKIVDHST